MTPIQQLFLGVGAKTKAYLDSVFSVDLWEGNATDNRAVTTGIDLASDGGLVWFKNRDATYNHGLVDTVRGAEKLLYSNSNAAQNTDATSVKSFTSTGFTLGTGNNVNGTSHPSHVAWSWKKAKGFFDVVNYTGDGNDGRTVAHGLGCIPGCIFVKRTDTTGEWIVLHKGIGPTKYVRLDHDQVVASNAIWANTQPTASQFYVNDVSHVNANGGTYVAYVFAGGESTNALARSVSFDGTNDYLEIPDSEDFNLGNTFTIEFWMKPDANTINSGVYMYLGSQKSNSWYIVIRGDGPNAMQFSDGTSAYNSAVNSIAEGQWTHVAFVANAGVGTWYINGTKSTDGGTVSAVNVPNSSSVFNIGKEATQNAGFYKGKLSNYRIVKGTAVYTSSFKPPTAPLENITNTKLLCCNNSSVTGSTVTPGTITAGDSPTASTDSPFLDPGMYKFGESGNQEIIKTGSYVGTATAATGPHVYLGWEPQFILVKNTAIADEWFMYDSARGLGGMESSNYANKMSPNQDNSEGQAHTDIKIDSTGFKLIGTNVDKNGDNQLHIYIAVRKQDGYTAKPPEVGTDVFAIDAGGGSSSTTDIPNFSSVFNPDAIILKDKSSSSNWVIGSRLENTTDGRALHTNTTNTHQSQGSNWTWDNTTGFYNYLGVYGTNTLGYLWKRHAGFDTVMYKGNGLAGHQIPHNLSVAPEMMLVKNFSDTGDWQCYHKGLNSGSNPEQYFLRLNTDEAEADSTTQWNDTAPSSSHFTVGTGSGVNGNNHGLIAYLFASVDKISKCGSYTGNGSTGQTITVGFQPRYLIIKCVSEAADWQTFDTVRGLGSGQDPALEFNTQDAQDTVSELDKTSTAFTLGNHDKTNKNNAKFIYYAHA